MPVDQRGASNPTFKKERRKIQRTNTGGKYGANFKDIDLYASGKQWENNHDLHDLFPPCCFSESVQQRGRGLFFRGRAIWHLNFRKKGARKLWQGSKMPWLLEKA